MSRDYEAELKQLEEEYKQAKAKIRKERDENTKKTNAYIGAAATEVFKKDVPRKKKDAKVFFESLLSAAKSAGWNPATIEYGEEDSEEEVSENAFDTFQSEIETQYE